MKKLFIAIYILTVADLVFTAIGVKTGVVVEANPVLNWIYTAYPILAMTLLSAVIGGILYGVYKVRSKVRFIVPLMVGVLAIKVVITGMHVSWISQMI